jgi:hypothetical protein
MFSCMKDEKRFRPLDLPECHEYKLMVIECRWRLKLKMWEFDIKAITMESPHKKPDSESNLHRS